MTEKGCWSMTVPAGSITIYAFERLDRSGHIYVKFVDRDRGGRDPRTKKKLNGNHTVRDAKGRVDPAKVREVHKAIAHLANSLVLDESPAHSSAFRRGALTLAEGFDKMLELGGGKFPKETRRYGEVVRARRTIEANLGRNMLWNAITPADVRRMWRRLAMEFANADSAKRVGGPRQPKR